MLDKQASLDVLALIYNQIYYCIKSKPKAFKLRVVSPGETLFFFTFLGLTSFNIYYDTNIINSLGSINNNWQVSLPFSNLSSRWKMYFQIWIFVKLLPARGVMIGDRSQFVEGIWLVRNYFNLYGCQQVCSGSFYLSFIGMLFTIFIYLLAIECY